MDRYKKLFKNIKNKNQGAFIPFIVLGDPNLNLSMKIIETLIDYGADALELGFPFSDPISDGPTIQKSSYRSLQNNITINKCFNIINEIRKKYLEIPIGILVYANVVFSNGTDFFYALCSKNKIDSILIPDLPVEESKFFLKFADYYKIAQIFVCPPNADDNLIKKISYYGKSYIYLSSRSGITGTENKAHLPSKSLVKKIKKFCSIPLIQGFGISEPKHIQNSLKCGISGSIVGSAIIKIIENNLNDPTIMIKNIKLFIRKMKKATILN